MLSRDLSRVFNVLVYPVCLDNVLNYISPGVLSKCSSVLCNFRGKGRIKKQNLSSKESGCLYLHVKFICFKHCFDGVVVVDLVSFCFLSHENNNLDQCYFVKLSIS